MKKMKKMNKDIFNLPKPPLTSGRISRHRTKRGRSLIADDTISINEEDDDQNQTLSLGTFEKRRAQVRGPHPF